MLRTRRDTLRRAHDLLPVATLLMLAACSDPGTGPAAQREPLDETSAQALAASVVEATDARLPHLPSLIRAAHEAIKANDQNAEAVGAFRQARRARVAAHDARLAGNAGEAARLLRLSHRLTLEGVIAALGPEVVSEAIAGVEAAIARWDEHTAGRDVPERFARALERARELAASARATDSPVAALSHALTAAEIIRSLSPAHLARRALSHATQVFRTALEAVGDSATDEENANLRRARRLLMRAREAFDSHEWAAAVRAALASAEISRSIIDGRGD